MKTMTLEQKVQKALDVLEVHNVMSRHAYFHQVGYHLQELQELWVRPDGKHGNTASFGQNIGYWVGMARIRRTYGELNEQNRKKNLAAVCKKYPEVKNVKENEGIGSLIMHTLTTPIIEVAGDGETAKGMWYSPGEITEVAPDGGTITMWMWEKYGADFAKEDGKWKLWHLHMYTDFAISPGQSWADPNANRNPFAVGDTVEKPPEMNFDIEVENYKQWSPTTVPQMVPMPEPYETFSQTFSYGPQ